jgi:recombination DNA repair RAD52 pathway protein
MLSNEQTAELLKPISPSRVAKDGKGFSHVEAWDIRRTMNAIFGIATWSADVTEMVMVTETEVVTRGGKAAWNVIYRARCTLSVNDCTYTEWAAGDATNPTLADAHDQAIKTAESQAFKRCAVNLGDQFGLSLYNNGSTSATVGEIVGQEHADSGKVLPLVARFADAESAEDLASIAQEIPGLEISNAEKETLRRAYTESKKRIDG